MGKKYSLPQPAYGKPLHDSDDLFLVRFNIPMDILGCRSFFLFL